MRDGNLQWVPKISCVTPYPLLHYPLSRKESVVVNARQIATAERKSRSPAFAHWRLQFVSGRIAEPPACTGAI
jgi:hypothetical protein